jgi:hypothetical protein
VVVGVFGRLDDIPGVVGMSVSFMFHDCHRRFPGHIARVVHDHTACCLFRRCVPRRYREHVAAKISRSSR